MKKFAKIMTKIGVGIASGIVWIGFMIGLTVNAIFAGVRDLVAGYSVRMVTGTYVEMITAVSKGFWDGLKETFVSIDKEIGA